MTNSGCNGGLQYKAFEYWETNKAETEEVYPYTSGNGSRPDCQYDASSATSVNVSEWAYVTADDVNQMKAALATQPLAVAIEADRSVFQNYKSGVLDNPLCGVLLDHAVLTVGWGTDEASGLDYWLVKNSWNTTWGDQGYIKLAIKSGRGICGVQMQPETVGSN